MASHAGRSRQARRKWAAKIANPEALTPAVCDRVVKDGGPTFRTTSDGHICNQTGAKLKRGQCQAYRLRVANGTTAMIAYRGDAPKKGKKRKLEVERYRAPVLPAMKELEWPGNRGYFKCPYCNHETYITYSGNHQCGYCCKTFKVAEKLRPTASNVKYYGMGYYNCPLCSRETWIGSSGMHNCDNCGKPINAEY